MLWHGKSDPLTHTPFEGQKQTGCKANIETPLEPNLQIYESTNNVECKRASATKNLALRTQTHAPNIETHTWVRHASLVHAPTRFFVALCYVTTLFVGFFNFRNVSILTWFPVYNSKNCAYVSSCPSDVIIGNIIISSTEIRLRCALVVHYFGSKSAKCSYGEIINEYWKCRPRGKHN